MLPTHSLIIDIAGLELTSEDKEVLTHPCVGGIIFFTRNYQNPQQLKSLTQSIRQLRPKLLLTVDQEGGRVQRFRDPFTVFPPVRTIGQLYDRDPDTAIKQATKMGKQLAKELSECDIELAFAPVLDIDYGINSVIGDRSWHGDPAVVTILAGAFVKGAKSVGLLTVGKHFPGHGNVMVDSHHALPIDQRDIKTILDNDIKPFVDLSSQLDGIMTSHVLYEKADAEPASFSQFWLKEILRQHIGFQGLIFSDDLSMQAAAFKRDIAARVQAALMAGCDKVLVCNDRAAVHQVLNSAM